MEDEGNGVYTIPCKVNGMPLKFIFDTGATDVVISLSEALFMLKNGFLNQDDIVGTSYSQIANGQITENTKIILREIEIDGLKLYNVTASVIHKMNAPLLLGQSAIQKLGKIQLDGNELLIYNGDNSNTDCTFENIIPFKIGMSDFDISLIILKNQEYILLDDSYLAQQRHHKKYIEYLKKEVDQGYLVVRKKFKNCINADVTYRLSLINDYLYRIDFDFGIGKVDVSGNIQPMLENFEFLKSIIPEEFKFASESIIKDQETGVKIGEGITFYTAEGSTQRKNKTYLKPNEIDLDYTIKTWKENGKTVMYNNAVLQIVDLRKTVLNNKGY